MLDILPHGSVSAFLLHSRGDLVFALDFSSLPPFPLTVLTVSEEVGGFPPRAGQILPSFNRKLKICGIIPFLEKNVWTIKPVFNCT
jgi:hypothetical protein